MNRLHPREVHRYFVPRSVLSAAEAFLRRRGSSGYEGVVFFGGHSLNGSEVLLDVLIIPQQEAHRTPFGVWVNVPGAAVADSIRELTARGSPLYAKIHTHPTEAYHSDTDDANPMMQFDGATSVVIPDFCAGDLANLESWAAYRLRAPRWTWEPIWPVSSTFGVVDSEDSAKESVVYQFRD